MKYGYIFVVLLSVLFACNNVGSNKENVVDNNVLYSNVSTSLNLMWKKHQKIRFDKLNSWNGVDARPLDNDLTVMVSTISTKQRVCGFNIDKSQPDNSPIPLRNEYDKICINVNNVSNRNKYSLNRLLKLELNNIPLRPQSRASVNDADSYYINNVKGLICFDLPADLMDEKIEKRNVYKVQFVFWDSQIYDLRLNAWFVNSIR